MVIKTASELKKLAKNVLSAIGTNDPNAEIVAEHLVSANLSGVDTHGVNSLPSYVQAVRDGLIVPNASPTILSETGTSAKVAGNWTFGHVAAKFAMETAVAKASDQAISVVVLVQANHIGRLGYYAELAASRGMIAQIWGGGYSEVAPVAVPYGGKTRVLHTNPLSMAFPVGDGAPMMFDYATTATSQIKVMNARARGQRLPEGWVVDSQGNTTTDPNDHFQGGALLPFGGHKGYALMVAAEFFGRIFSQADQYAEDGRGGPLFGHQGVAMIAIRADTFQPFADYASKVTDMERRIHAVPAAQGFKEVLIPGDMEHRAREARSREGIPLHDDVWQSLSELATSLGIGSA